MPEQDDQTPIENPGGENPEGDPAPSPEGDVPSADPVEEPTPGDQPKPDAAGADAGEPAAHSAEEAIEATQESVDELAKEAEPSSAESTDSPEEEEALRVAQAAMAALNDDDPEESSAPSQDEIDALTAAQEALGALNEETSAVDAAAADAEAEAAMAAALGGGGGAAPVGDAFNWQDFSKDAGAGEPESIDLLGDVNLNVKIELGRTRMLVEDVLCLDKGSVVELDKLAGDPVDIYVNGQPVARGEVLVLNDNFCVRINEILSPAQADALRDVS